jgi:hypothetical protein
MSSVCRLALAVLMLVTGGAAPAATADAGIARLA